MNALELRRWSPVMIAVALLFALVLAGRRTFVFQSSHLDKLKEKGAHFVDGLDRGILDAELNGSQFTDADALRLLSFPTLERVVMEGTSMSDIGAMHLSGLPGLLRLDLSGTKITREGLQVIAGFPRLWELDVRDCPNLSVADLQVLGTSKSLQSIQADYKPCPADELDATVAALGRRWDSEYHQQYLRAPAWLRIEPAADVALNSKTPLQAEVSLDRLQDEFGPEPEKWRQAFEKVLYLDRVTDLTIPRPDQVKAPDRLSLLPQFFPELLGLLISDWSMLDVGWPERELSPVTDNDLRWIGKCRQLTRLRTYGHTKDTFTDRGLEALASLSALQSLQLSYSEVHGRGLEQLGKLTSLQSLSLYLPQLEELSIDTWQNLQQLKSLHLASLNSGLDGSPLKVLGTITSLEELHLSLANTEEVAVDSWQNLQHLKQLYLNVGKLRSSQLAVIGQLSSLERLRLSCANVEGTGLDHLGRLKNLREMDLSFSNTDRIVVDSWSGLQNLKYLVLDFASVRGDELVPLGELKQLEGLRFGNNMKMDGANLDWLDRLPNLRNDLRP